MSHCRSSKAAAFLYFHLAHTHIHTLWHAHMHIHTHTHTHTQSPIQTHNHMYSSHVSQYVSYVKLWISHIPCFPSSQSPRPALQVCSLVSWPTKWRCPFLRSPAVTTWRSRGEISIDIYSVAYITRQRHFWRWVLSQLTWQWAVTGCRRKYSIWVSLLLSTIGLLS